MESSILKKAARFLREQSRHRHWQEVVTAMAAVVVFVTVYALILPAVTMEKQVTCGMEEHTHTEECIERRLVCGLSEEAASETDEMTAAESEAAETQEPTEAGLTASTDGTAESRTTDVGEASAQAQVHVHTDACYEIVYICGKEEHHHTEACYADHEADVEAASDWEASLNGLQLTDVWNADTAAVAESQTGYRESEKNYIMTETGDKQGYSRYGAWSGEGREYDDWNSLFVSFCLHYAGIPEEAIDLTAVLAPEAEAQLPSWYQSAEALPETLQAGDLVFWDTDADGQPDRVAVVKSLDAEQNRITVIEGDCDGAVAEREYLLAAPEASGTEAAEEAAENRLTVCWTGSADLAAAKEQWNRDQTGETMPEETEPETESENEPEGTIEYKAGVLEYTGPDYVIRVEYPAEAMLPENVTLEVREIEPGSDEYEMYYRQSVEALAAAGTEDGTVTENAGQTADETEPEKEITATDENSDRTDYVTFARFFDIQLVADGVVLEPAAPVEVTITYTEGIETGADAEIRNIHFAESGTELLTPSTEEEEGKIHSVTHTQDSFSVVGTVIEEGVTYYIVKVYDAGGTLMKEELVRAESSFSYTYEAGNVSSCLIVYGNGTTETQIGKTASIASVTTSVVISPGVETTDTMSQYSVTFKVYMDGEWKEVGSLPYYYTGSVNGTERAYITSDMAAQFFGEFGYDAATAPGYTIGYSYNDIYQIYYVSSGAKTEYCMDVNGNKIENNTAIQLWKDNGSDAQLFRIRNSGEGYKYLTPVGNSSYHVNVLGGGTTDGTKLGIHTATDAASHWRVIYHADGTVSFTNKNAPDTAYIDLPSGTVKNGNQLQIWTNGGNRYWSLEQRYRVSNDTVSEPMSDGRYKIGLTAEGNGDIVCYYIPKATGSITNVAESKLPVSEELYYSVSVVDDSHLVYSKDELAVLEQHVKNGETATVTVKNANGVIWSCVGKSGQPLNMTSTQANGKTTFVFENITQGVEIVATKANPSFTVQYYANIPRYATSGSTALTVIDTSAASNGGKATLPTNGGTMKTKSLYLEAAGGSTNQNNGDQTPLYQIKTTTELTKLYSDKECQYESSPSLEYFNKLKDNESYILNELWILKPGRNSTSTNRNDWTIYSNPQGLSFTNEAALVDGHTILITDDMVMRLVSNSSSGNYYNGTTFYDYNISSGQNADGRWRTGITGINSESNYGTSINGKRTWRSGADILAFGNANCGTGMSGYYFDNGPLNKWNGTVTKDGQVVYTGVNGNYGGATFELVSKLNSNGTIQYNEWIVAPKLFNDGDAAGKQTYSGSSLTFSRIGDTYTLSAATLKNSNGQSNTQSGLQYFFNPSPYAGKVWSIFTNNFWPMDPAAGRTDALWGQYGNPGSFQGFVESNNYNWGALAADFPASDDGKAHNWFFGMNFSLSFTLTEDYVGPLEYYFFGDDDMWVFLDGKLICDIGGVHSSIGEYVNLRDYLPVGSSGTHTLSFFYTERGASGSTCYMSFTLPSVSSATTEQNTGSLKISKTLGGVDDDAAYGENEYKFQVELLTEEDGSALNQTFTYIRSDGTNNSYGTVKSGGTITLKAGESATISGIPAGTFYRVTELTHDGYKTTVNGNQGYITKGTIENGNMKEASFVNTPHTELPETGGIGAIWYTMAGAGTLLGTGLVYNQKRRKGGHRTSES